MLPFTNIEKIAEPPRPPEHAAEWWGWLALGVLILVGAAIFAGLMVALYKRASLPPLPGRPDKMALREIKSLRRRGASVEGPAFGVALTEIIRVFLHRRLGLPARYATTPQLLGRSRRDDEPPPPPVIETFAAALDGCDALKFSTGASQATRDSLLDAAEAAVKSVAAAPPPRVLTLLSADTSHALPA